METFLIIAIVLLSITLVAAAVFLFTRLLSGVNERIQAMHPWKNYQEYLASPLWQLKRNRVLKRDKYACRLCCSNRSLQVHHRKYPTHWGFEPESDLITLCGKCHLMFHRDRG